MGGPRPSPCTPVAPTPGGPRLGHSRPHLKGWEGARKGKRGREIIALLIAFVTGDLPHPCDSQTCLISHPHTLSFRPPLLITPPHTLPQHSPIHPPLFTPPHTHSTHSPSTLPSSHPLTHTPHTLCPPSPHHTPHTHTHPTYSLSTLPSSHPSHTLSFHPPLITHPHTHIPHTLSVHPPLITPHTHTPHTIYPPSPSNVRGTWLVGAAFSPSSAPGSSVHRPGGPAAASRRYDSAAMW